MVSRADGPAAVAALLRDRARRGELWIPVDGASMSPTLQPGTEVLVRPGARPRPGEVWAAVGVDGALVVHRCVWLRPGGPWTFRGDAEPDDDVPVSEARLVGRVVANRGAAGAARPVRASLTRVLATLPGRVVSGVARRASMRRDPGRPGH